MKMIINYKKPARASYECSDLIEELQADIDEFGDFELIAIRKEVNGCVFYTDYDFLEEDGGVPPDVLALEGEKKIMNSRDLLREFIKQNTIII